MGSQTPAPLVEQTNATVKTSVGRSCAPKTKGNIPKIIHKAEREKLKREYLNELFLDMANALDPNQPNNGKASVLCEATRLLKDLFSQIESLKKENSSLLSEFHYVNIEKNELKEENATLETQIRELRSEIEIKVAQSKTDLNEPPPHLPAVETSLQQPPTLLVVPLHPSIQSHPMLDSATQPVAKPNSIVRKPHARYPTPTDTWPSKLLGEQSTIRNE
ncbi:hypothetical protein V6N13_086424 [Hibiscus sabdariffa]|uniref:Iron-related transcription factor 3 bHLH domain-containing protein n=1 Tax=Hibiscus sabdariffa TaxID=183260 RepID=A0ABR2FTD5_9ROSI